MMGPLICCKRLGLRGSDLFETPDLYEQRNINVVINTLHVLGHYVERMESYQVASVQSCFAMSDCSSDVCDALGAEDCR